MNSTHDGSPSAFAEALLSGGDDRLTVGPDGLNNYGCAPAPRGAIEFGSCTSSTISSLGHRTAFHAWRRIQASNTTHVVDLVDEMMEEVRSRLRAWLGSPASLGHVILTPSGTDAELLALHLVAAQSEGQVLNIVVAPDEVGSGTLAAASCRHFAKQTPSGRLCELGAAVDPALAGRVTSAAVNARHPDSSVRSANEVEEELRALATPFAKRGDHVLIHAVAHSKTGICAPGEEPTARLEEMGGNVHVLVDAAQGRLSQETIVHHLNRGRLVLFTGSKFFGGPTFSGALFVPTSYPLRNTSLPSGYADYFTRPEIPLSWTNERASLNQRLNIGLVLRWHAALAEMEALDRLDPGTQEATLRLFAEAVTQAVNARPGLQLVSAQCSPQSSAPVNSPLEILPSVFNFSIRNSTGKTWDRPALKRRHAWLNRPLGAFLLKGLDPHEERVANQVFHLGQPVMISPGVKESPRAVLRIALGAPLLRFLAAPPVEATEPDRLRWLQSHLSDLTEKLHLIDKFAPDLGCY